MNLARSTYYYRLKHQKKTLEREKKDIDLKELMDEIEKAPPDVFHILFAGFR